MARGRAVRVALDEMNPGYGRQLFQVRHGETQGAVHHAVDGEAMFVRIELGKLGGVLLHEMDRGRRDDARIVLKRGVVGQVIEAVSGPTARRLVVNVQPLRRSRLAPRGQTCAYSDT